MKIYKFYPLFIFLIAAIVQIDAQEGEPLEKITESDSLVATTDIAPINKVEEIPTYYYYLETLVYDNQSRNSIRFISRKFECTKAGKALEDLWIEQFKNSIYESHKIWGLYRDVRKSKVKLIRANSLRNYFVNFNKSKTNYNKPGSVRMVNFAVMECGNPKDSDSAIVVESEHKKALEKVK